MKRTIVVVGLTLLASASLCFGQKSKDKDKAEIPPSAQEEEEKFRSYVVLQPETVGASLPPILMGTLRPVELAREGDSWAVQVVTRGGFTGGGKGDVMIASDGGVSCSPATDACERKLSPAGLQALAQMIAAAKPSKWDGSSVGTCRDCYVTMLTLHRREQKGREKTYTVYWDDTTQGRMPAEVRQLHQEIVTLVERDKLSEPVK